MKNYVRVLAVIFAMFLSFSSYIYTSADETSLSMVENIIAGNQDKLVFATVVSVGSKVCTVEVMEEIGGSKPVENKIDGDSVTDSVNLLGEKIEIEGMDSYMYYDGFVHNPKIGDNVLLSLTFDGNVCKVRNGVFRVSAASYDSFNFIVPDTVENTGEAMELTALYKFIASGGLNSDFEIKDFVVYTHNLDGREIQITEPEGISFVNEKGETTKDATGGNIEGDTDRYNVERNPYTWLYAMVIIAVGAIAGFFVVRLIIKFEKRAEP